MSPPTANPTTGKTHVAEKIKFHEGSLKPYSHEELGTADDVRWWRPAMKWNATDGCVVACIYLCSCIHVCNMHFVASARINFVESISIQRTQGIPWWSHHTFHFFVSLAAFFSELGKAEKNRTTPHCSLLFQHFFLKPLCSLVRFRRTDVPRTPWSSCWRPNSVPESDRSPTKRSGCSGKTWSSATEKVGSTITPTVRKSTKNTTISSRKRIWDSSTLNGRTKPNTMGGKQKNKTNKCKAKK